MAKNNLGIPHLANWKPLLLANDTPGEIVNWDERLVDIDQGQWILSEKADGGRVELVEDGRALSRELKEIQSSQVQFMAAELTDSLQHSGIIEAEFYAPNMTFSELMHFFKTADVTSESSVAKYTKLWEKTKGDPAKGWKYPGRSVEWLTTWHSELQFYVFDQVWSDSDDRGKWQRYQDLKDLFKNAKPKYSKIINQFEVTHIDQVHQAYDQSIINGGEGLVAFRKDALYKNGRLTLNQGDGYKIKDSNNDYEGIIIGVEEGTIVKDGVEKSVNNFGRSKTSQLKDDRIPSGMAKGFLVRMEDGRELTVSLNGYDHDARKVLLANPEHYIGEEITFSGMPPVSARLDSVPRHCHYTRGRNNLRS